MGRLDFIFGDPWVTGSVPRTPTKWAMGILLKIAFFPFFPPRRGRSHFRDFKHLFDVKQLFEADISLLKFDSPPADRLAVIRRRRRDFCRFGDCNGHLGGERVVQSS